MRRLHARMFSTPRLSFIVSHFDWLLVACFPLAIYLLTLQNGLTPEELQGGDRITHHYAQATLRFANAPGYPIFTMLGWLWFQISSLVSPFFNPIERLSLYSTLYAIPALLLLHHLIRKIIIHDKSQTYNRPSPIALLATLCYAFTYFFWYYAISSENYSSGVLNTLALIALALRWQERRDERTLLWLAFVCGLSLAHLLTVALAVPTVLCFVLAQQPDYLRRPRLIIKTWVAALLPLISYAYVYWRGAAHPEWRGRGQWADAWSWFVDFLTTKQGQSELTWSWDGVPWEMLRIINDELTWPVLLGGLIGLALLPRWRAFLLLGIVVVYTPIMYIDRYGNWYQAIMPLYPIVVIGFANLLNKIFVWLGNFSSPASPSQAAAIGASAQPQARISHGLRLLLMALLGLLALVKLVGNYPATNLRGRPSATGLQPGFALLADGPAPDARIVGAVAENLALDYLTQVWGTRTDVRAIGVAQAKAVGGQPLYASRTAMPFAQQNSTVSTLHRYAHGLNLIELRNEPLRTLPTTVTPVHQSVTQGLELVGYTLQRIGAQYDLALFWRAERRLEVDMAVSVRLMNGNQPIMVDGQAFQTDSTHPVFGFYPMSRWQVGEIVRDDYALPLMVVAQANRARVLVYRTVAGGFENLGEVSFAWSNALNR